MAQSKNTQPVAELIDEDANIWITDVEIDNADFGTRTVRYEHGLLAQQSQGAVTAYLDDETMVLATTNSSSNPRDGIDFFPLTVDVEERMYAAGRIPGSFFRREGRPSSDAILAARLIDRPLRPIFTKGIRNEVQVIITVLSVDPKDKYDVLAINAASASTLFSGLPVSSAVGGVRMALVVDEKHPQGQWVAFPTAEQTERAVFELVVAGRVLGESKGKGRGAKSKNSEPQVAIMMVEAGATDTVTDRIADGAPAPTEKIVAEGIEAAKPFIASLCAGQQSLLDAAGEKKTREVQLFEDYSDDTYAAVKKAAGKKLSSIMSVADKDQREEQLDALRTSVTESLGEDQKDQANAALSALSKEVVRENVLKNGTRMDGRAFDTIRDLSITIDVVPRAHGSAIFERGETQILGVTTLDTLKMEQQIDSLSGEDSKRYMHHYNFPPFSVGDTGRVGSPKRREIGHGALAERALVPVLPSREDFPYAIRQVSEAMGSNGSTSMGSVCASTLSLFNAGVPLKAPVAGIAMGLISGKVSGKDKYVTLTDILGAEDAFGDMDFKVAGTSDYVTALQLDTKLDGIPSEVLAQALDQAHDARLSILSVMQEGIDGPEDMSPYAPRITSIQIPEKKIGELIGPKGKTINEIQDESGAKLSVEDDGKVFVSATDGEAADKAIKKINSIVNVKELEVGQQFNGKVVKTTAFGAFVNLVPGRDGLVHISNLGGDERIKNVEDVINEGDSIEVEIADIDNRGKISLVPVDSK